MAHARNIIGRDEVLLMFGTTLSGQTYASYSTALGNEYTIDMLLDEPGDQCIRLIVLNTKTLRSSDVTELFARQWLRRLDADQHGIDPEDEHRFPAYVRDSREWAVWRDDLRAEAKVYSATREHGTLSHRLQGLSHA